MLFSPSLESGWTALNSAAASGSIDTDTTGPSSSPVAGSYRQE